MAWATAARVVTENLMAATLWRSVECVVDIPPVDSGDIHRFPAEGLVITATSDGNAVPVTLLADSGDIHRLCP